jgi:hypothetical protein
VRHFIVQPTKKTALAQDHATALRYGVRGMVPFYLQKGRLQFIGANFLVPS